MRLDPNQLRVLGALIEKEITTPENYPLSLNALIAACNQRSSRDPVLELTEDEVRQAVHSLEDMEIVAPVRESRVPKYEHRIRTVLNLRRDETAVLCLLLLRGPQTPGELRGRADRMYSFDDIAAVQSTLERLAARNIDTQERPDSGHSRSSNTAPLVVMLARQPGSRESRYAHLLGEIASEFSASERQGLIAQRKSATGELAHFGIQLEATFLERINALETTVMHLQSRIEAIESDLRKV